MNTLMNASLSMTSREIADLVESRHDSVKRTIERLAEGGVIQLPPLVIAERINGLGLTQKSEHYIFTGEQGKRDSIVVVAQLSPEFTARLVDRWQELEAQLVQTSPAQSNVFDPLRGVAIAMEAAKAFGFEGNQAILSADKAVRAITGFNFCLGV